jgi:pimeloyl-ACP methyl ester carboxylesterase
VTPPDPLKRAIRVPTVAFAGTDDPMAEISDYEHARTMFSGEYVVQTMRGGHFMHREHPDEFAEKLLAHLLK